LNISLKYIILSYAYQLPLFTKRQFTYRSDNGHTGARETLSDAFTTVRVRVLREREFNLSLICHYKSYACAIVTAINLHYSREDFHEKYIRSINFMLY